MPRGRDFEAYVVPVDFNAMVATYVEMAENDPEPDVVSAADNAKNAAAFAFSFIKESVDKALAERQAGDRRKKSVRSLQKVMDLVPSVMAARSTASPQL